MSLPTGTLTFLFTDIVGSTRLWDLYPEAMSRAHARHSDLFTECVERHQGSVVRNRGEGDSRFAVFPNPPDALAAILAVQFALHIETWPEETPIRIRAALHTGDAELREDDYNSTAVNRCARLRSLAFGGQTLLSGVTCALVTPDLPEGVTLRDMGLHRLKDLSQPEQIFQLCHPALPEQFPPLPSLETLPNNLPQQLSSFIGREREMEEVRTRLSQCRLLTLTGAGGTGKTRLSLQVGADLLEQYADGVWFVELASLSDPKLLTQTVAQTFGLREQAGKPLFDTLIDYLKTRTLLLILDNCEHLVEGCARLAERLLRACPNLKMLTSSRESLNITGENVYRLPSLTLPPPPSSALTGEGSGRSPSPPAVRDTPSDTSKESGLSLETLMAYEAVQLFCDRAMAAAPHQVLTAASGPAIVQICRRLDGIPLALELAAVRVKALSVEHIASRLDNVFHLLTGGSRVALPRQQTLRALIDWSYDLLSEPEQLLLARLSIFVGGWTLEAAEFVCADSSSDVLDLLSQLVDKSLVIVEEQREGIRYRLLETIRQYGRERLEQTAEGVAPLQERHLRYFLTFAQEAADAQTGPEQTQWLDRLEIEYDNLRAALDTGLQQEEERDLPPLALRLASTLQYFWHVRGYLREGRERLAAALAREDAQATTQARASALYGLGTLAFCQADLVTAEAEMQRSLAAWRELNIPKGISQTLIGLGNVRFNQIDFAEAQRLYEEALPYVQSSGDSQRLATLRSNLGNIAFRADDYPTARARFEEALAIHRQNGDRVGITAALNALGSLALYTKALEEAAIYYTECLELCLEVRDRRITLYVLECCGYIAHKHKQEEGAIQLYAAADAIRRRFELAMTPGEHALREEMLIEMREAGGEALYAEAWAQGNLLTFENAIELAQRLLAFP